MLSLSPAKLLVVLVVALIVLGPEKLPQVARQFGALWADLRKWRAKLETEMRSTFPDMPPTHEVVQAVRSPLAFLDRLADAHETSNGSVEPSSEPAANDEPPGPGAAVESRAEPPPNSNGAYGAGARGSVSGQQVVPDDPSMN